MAGRGADEGRRKLPGSGRAHPSRPRPEVTAPRTEIAAMERREAPALPTMERGKTEDWCADWRSIPSAFCRGSTPPGPLAEVEKRPAPAKAGGRRRTRRRSNNMGAHARPFGIRAIAHVCAAV